MTQNISNTADGPAVWDLVRRTATPACLATTASNGRWKAARHLLYKDRLLTDLVGNRLRANIGDVSKPASILVIHEPPQHGKSTQVSKWFPAWYAGTFPDRTILHNSYGGEYSAEWGQAVRDLLAAWGPQLFGQTISRYKHSSDKWSLAGFESSGGMYSAGIGGATTGRPGKLVIIDDPIKNAEEALSKAYRDKIWSWYGSVITTRLHPDSHQVLIETPWHRECLGLRIVERAKETGLPVRWVRLPALAEHDDELGRTEGDALWPEERPASWLLEQKSKIEPYWWHALYMCRPTQPEGTDFKDGWFGDWIYFDNWPELFQLRAMALDPSKGKDAKHGDYSAFVLGQRDADGTIYVDADLERRPVPKMIADGVSLYREFRPDGFVIEANVWQELLGTEFQRAFEEAGMTEYSPYLIENRVNKIVRIRRLATWLSTGQIRFKRNSPGAALLLSQLREFPIADHDDGPDALEMLMRLFAYLVDAPAPDSRSPIFTQVYA